MLGTWRQAGSCLGYRDGINRARTELRMSGRRNLFVLAVTAAAATSGGGCGVNSSSGSSGGAATGSSSAAGSLPTAGATAIGGVASSSGNSGIGAGAAAPGGGGQPSSGAGGSAGRSDASGGNADEGGTGGVSGSGGSLGGSASGSSGSSGMGGAAGSGALPYMPCPTNGEACEILPFGDSITEGVKSSDDAGYRSQLFKLIVAAKQKVTFTGSLSGGPAQVSGQTFPRMHEGHAGWTIDPGYSEV